MVVLAYGRVPARKAVAFLVILMSWAIYSANAQTIDDSFTYFKADAVNGPDNTYRWNLLPEISIPDAAKGSPLRLVLKQNGKEIYSHTCNLAGRTGTQTIACVPRDKMIAETGLFNVEVFLNDKLLRKYKIDVRKTTRQGNRRPDFYIQRHADVAVGYLSKSEPSTVLRLNTVYSPIEDWGESFGYTPELKCSVNGSPVAFVKPQLGFRQAAGRVINGFSESIDAKKGLVRDTIRFDQLDIQLPLKLGGPKMNVIGSENIFFDVTSRPGKWQCEIVGTKTNGVFRTFRFEVAGGTIVAHPEQSSGNVNLDRDKWLIDLEIPKGGSEIDKRLLPSPNAGLFYGIPWATAEGKAMGARVPKKGTPFPAEELK